MENNVELFLSKTQYSTLVHVTSNISTNFKQMNTFISKPMWYVIISDGCNCATKPLVNIDCIKKTPERKTLTSVNYF